MARPDGLRALVRVGRQPGESARVQIGCSEVCGHLGVADRPLTVRLVPGRLCVLVQLVDDAGAEVSFPILATEAGLVADSTGVWWGRPPAAAPLPGPVLPAHERLQRSIVAAAERGYHPWRVDSVEDGPGADAVLYGVFCADAAVRCGWGLYDTEAEAGAVATRLNEELVFIAAGGTFVPDQTHREDKGS